MTPTNPTVATVRGVTEQRFRAIGTTAVLLVTEPSAAGAAEEVLRTDLTLLDLACSRFRADSEIRALECRAGSPARVSRLLADVLDVALRAAELTDGAVDPTVGGTMAAIGYDRDRDAIRPDGPPVTPAPAPGWWRITWNSRRRELLLPRGIRLDVGATAKALAADRAAERIAATCGCGTLVALGGDIAVAGPPPPGGWHVLVGDDHTRPDRDGGHGVTIRSGGLATSGTARRRWRRGATVMHHIVDPRTGLPAAGGWRTVSVAAGTCVDANTASTASIVLGTAAPRWLAERNLPARLVADDGTAHTMAGWPVDDSHGL